MRLHAKTHFGDGFSQVPLADFCGIESDVDNAIRIARFYFQDADPLAEYRLEPDSTGNAGEPGDAPGYGVAFVCGSRVGECDRAGGREALEEESPKQFHRNAER